MLSGRDIGTEITLAFKYDACSAFPSSPRFTRDVAKTKHRTAIFGGLPPYSHWYRKVLVCRRASYKEVQQSWIDHILLQSVRVSLTSVQVFGAYLSRQGSLVGGTQDYRSRLS